MRERRLADSVAPRPTSGPATGRSIDHLDVQNRRAAARSARCDADRLRFIAPDDGNADDRTVAEVPLDTPVAPGGTIEVADRLDGARAAHRSRGPASIDDYYFIAQWFPKIGVLAGRRMELPSVPLRDGVLRRLRRLRRPADGAGGLDRSAPPASSATSTRRSGGIEDASLLSGGRARLRVDDEPATIVEQRARSSIRRCRRSRCACCCSPSTRARKSATSPRRAPTLRYYGEWFGAYPYGHITIVDPAWQSGTGGMEYPTLFTAGSRWLAPRDATHPEGVTVHEAGHQFWYGIVATNEFEDGWMDEGFNTFSTARVIEQQFQPNYYVERYFGGFVPWVFQALPLDPRRRRRSAGGYRRYARQDVQATPTFRYWPAPPARSPTTRPRSGCTRSSAILAGRCCSGCMSTYFQRYAFKHPRPQDFFAVANEVSGQDLTWYFDQVYRGIPDLRLRGRFRSAAIPGRTDITPRWSPAGSATACFPVTVRVTLPTARRRTGRGMGAIAGRCFRSTVRSPR